MPIANSFLSNHRILKVKNPVFSPSGNLPTGFSSYSEIVCKNFSSNIEVNTTNKTLVQNWPAAQYLDIKPFIYNTKIEMPILLDKNGIHTEEITFFNNWLRYMTSTFDHIPVTGYNFSSIIVDNASVNISENDISLSLSFKSNFPLDWKPSTFGTSSNTNKKLHARKAKNYDTYVKFVNYNSAVVDDNTVLGWDNKYGISNFQVNYQSEIEEIYLTVHNLSDSMTIDNINLACPHRPDMMNVKSISCNGNISIFGPEMETMGVSTQSYQSMEFSPVNTDIFSMALNNGAIQIFIGELDLTPTVNSDLTTVNYDNLIPLTFIPTGIMINGASTEFAGGQIYKHNRQFTGVFTNTPIKVLQDSTTESAYLS